MATNEELLNLVEQLSVRAFKAEVRLESLLRLMMAKGSLSLDEFQGAVHSFQSLNNVLGQINEVHSIIDKVNAASKFNETAPLKIAADDLGLKKIIEDAGGTSDFTARMILSKLPMSSGFKTFISQFIDRSKNPSPDALIPDQVISPS